MHGEGKKIKEAGRRDAASEKKLSRFTRSSRRLFLCVNGVLDDLGGAVMFVRRYVALRCLWR